jgi:ubiquinone biosynthesis protein Coq4
MAAKCVISYKLEDGWEQPLSEWRRELQLPENPQTGD